LHLEFPFAGSRMLRDFLNKEGVEIGRCHVTTLMRRMGIEALYRRPNTSKPAPGHRIYPYLLRAMTIDRPNQVPRVPVAPAALQSDRLGADGPWTLPTSQWCAGSSTSPRSSTGVVAGFSLGDCRSRWRPPSASRRWKRPWPATAGRRSSIPTRDRSSPAWPSPAC
jgi:hypothetical protein